MKRILLWVSVVIAPLLIMGSAGGQAPDYPSKPIRLIVPFPPGAGTDAVARLVANRLSETMKVPIVVDNRTGAGGAIGTAEAAKSDPDGYTLLFVASPFTTVAAASSNPGYDPVGQFTPVAPLHEIPKGDERSALVRFFPPEP